MIFSLLPISSEDLSQFKRDMQEAFQKGFEEVYGKTEGTILPEQDMDSSLSEKGSIAYKAVVDGEMVGGAIVVTDSETSLGQLHLLYVKHSAQSRGIGALMWHQIEKLHPDTKTWETCTPYFEKRNIHFYVNKCGFHIVEYQFRPSDPQDGFMEEDDGMFIFRKQM